MEVESSAIHTLLFENHILKLCKHYIGFILNLLSNNIKSIWEFQIFRRSSVSYRCNSHINDNVYWSKNDIYIFISANPYRITEIQD